MAPKCLEMPLSSRRLMDFRARSSGAAQGFGRATNRHTNQHFLYSTAAHLASRARPPGSFETEWGPAREVPILGRVTAGASAACKLVSFLPLAVWCKPLGA